MDERVARPSSDEMSRTSRWTTAVALSALALAAAACGGSSATSSKSTPPKPIANSSPAKNSAPSANWSPQVSGVPEDLTAVSFVDKTHGWAVGTVGTILTRRRRLKAAARGAQGRIGKDHVSR
jgi:hypothetical protein